MLVGTMWNPTANRSHKNKSHIDNSALEISNANNATASLWIIEDSLPIGILMDALLIQGPLNVTLDVHAAASRTGTRDELWSTKCLVASSTSDIIELNSVIRHGIDHGRL